jgi:hypothetical protein
MKSIYFYFNIYFKIVYYLIILIGIVSIPLSILINNIYFLKLFPIFSMILISNILILLITYPKWVDYLEWKSMKDELQKLSLYNKNKLLVIKIVIIIINIFIYAYIMTR